jgi:chemotaxis protein CheD
VQLDAPAIASAGLGELAVVQRSDMLLTARGLGSCIGISVYEPNSKIAALAHVMLPGPMTIEPVAGQPARFADQAVESIVELLQKRGGRTRDCVIKLAGGAQVIRLANKDDKLQVGKRNIEAVLAALEKRGLRVSAQRVGGNMGRTLTLYAATGITTVRLVGGVEEQL